MSTTITEKLSQLSSILIESLVELKKKGSKYDGKLNYRDISAAFSTLPTEYSFDKVMNESSEQSKLICKVSSVCDYAFAGVTDLSAVQLRGVKSISEYAFYGNTTVKSIQIYTSKSDIDNIQAKKKSPWGASNATVTWYEWN